MTAAEFKELALSFPESVEASHFDRIAFKVPGKRIFATLQEATASVNLKLSDINQSVFCCIDKDLIYRVPNKWGLQGWTTFELEKVPRELMHDALGTAYNDVFKSKLKKKK
jgi:hypothetical protein